MIDILLATYNGEKFIAEQLQSIFAQTYQHFRILIRDDGSTDKTLSIINDFVCRYSEKICVLPSSKRLGVQGNFSELIGQANSPYIMLCDQDDVWLPEKIALSLTKIKNMESQYGSDTPILVHTDLNVVDKDLKMIDTSFWHFANLYPHRSHSLNRLIVQNVVTGCTIIVNRSLSKIAYPIPVEAIMHDWWLALVAAAFGKIDILNAPTIYYRQHTKNTLGAQKFRSWQCIKEGLKRLRASGLQRHLQAQKFVECYQTDMSEKSKKILQAYLSHHCLNWIQKRYLILKFRFYKNGFLRNAAHFMFAR